MKNYTVTCGKSTLLHKDTLKTCYMFASEIKHKNLAFFHHLYWYLFC